MEITRCLLTGFEASKAYLFLALNELFLAVFMILIESVTSSGVSAFVIVVYEHVIATILLAVLAFFLERSVLLSSSSLWRLSWEILVRIVFITCITVLVYHRNMVFIQSQFIQFWLEWCLIVFIQFSSCPKKSQFKHFWFLIEIAKPLFISSLQSHRWT